MGRYYKEIGKSNEKVEIESTDQAPEKEQDEGINRPGSFLKKIQDFFEKDGV